MTHASHYEMVEPGMKKTDLSKVLNSEQAAAASEISGPLLIIAGAGSGKTRMITYRIAHMLEEGIDEKNILALTFTNKAAKEMSDRIRGQVGKPLKDLTATTFHSFGLGILKQYIQHLGYHNDFTLYDTNDNEALIKNCIVTCGYQIPDYNVRTLLSFFSNLKTGREKMENPDGAIAEIYREWLLTQKAYNVVDFDDLILLPIKLFESKPWILEAVQERYRYVMVDEFQDTSLLQYRLVSMIAAKYRNIAVVGDDDQSIYSWRGANYENIVQFEKDFPERKEFKLERNYRSTGNILTAANALIKHNTERKDKKLWTDEGSGAAISIKRHRTSEAEAYWIGSQIKESMRQIRDLKYGDIGVLVRTNALISELENVFAEMSIPVRISGGQSFFDRREVRDILCYLKVLINKHDDVSLLRIINTPRRGIGRTTIEKLRSDADSCGTSLFEAMEHMSGQSSPLQERTKENLRSFISKIAEWRNSSASPDNLIRRIVNDIHYQGMLSEEFPDGPKAVDFRMRSIEILENRLKRYLEMNEGAELKEYLNAVAIVGDEKEDDGNKVNLMTMHASKGLEFRIVHLAGIEDDVIPSARALEENSRNIDEERRLFYVAITRAREKLVINYADTRVSREGDIKLVIPSRFLEEIPKDLFKNEEKSPEELRKEQIARMKAMLERNNNRI